MTYVLIPGKGVRVPSIADIMRSTCEFQRYRDRQLWYRIRYTTPAPDDYRPELSRESWDIRNEGFFDFPISVDDGAASGTFEPEMKAVNLMRWIRQAIADLREAVDAQG